MKQNLVYVAFMTMQCSRESRHLGTCITAMYSTVEPEFSWAES